MSQATSAEKANDTSLGELPEWDLSDLYQGPDDPALEAELERAAADAKAFRERYAGALDGFDGDALGAAIEAYEAIEERLGRIASYAQLEYARDMANAEIGRFYQGVRERTSDVSTELLFFTLELNRIGEAALEEKATASERLARYRPWLRRVRAMREHQLSDELERLLHEKAIAGAGAWSRLFEETVASLRFTIGGETLSSAQALDRLQDPDEAVRREAAEEIGRVFGDNLRTFATVTNTLAKDKEIEDRWRGFTRPVSARNLANDVEDEVVDALVEAVRNAYPDTAHRYYALKARWMGKERLQHWDRNAPLPDAPERRFTWPEAQATVLDAYAGFSAEMAHVGARFFEGGWIDAPVKPGKSPGAFAHPTVPSAHPYLLLNYQGRTRDVMTLAHELGHGVHQVLAAPQGALMADTPLTLAETASVFGEMLTFRAILDAEEDPAVRRRLLAGKIEDMLNTVVRQIAFYSFEERVHAERREGELLPERICEIWLDVQRESLGPVFEFTDEYRLYWTYVPHFVHAPFYVYAYAFGDCLVNALYAVYEQAEEGFAERYLDMLRAGGTLRHKELLAPFGLDASDPSFWDKGLGVLRGMIDELEAME